MAIKIIKEGRKTFIAFCERCGCEFTYDLADLKLSCASDKIVCPTCGKDYYHPAMIQDCATPNDIGRLQTWPLETHNDPCEGCAWKTSLRSPGTYIGDSPCTWCTKNQVTCKVQAVQPSLIDYAIPCKAEPAIRLQDCDCDENATCSKCSNSGNGYTIATNSDCLCKGDVWKTVQDCCECAIKDIEEKRNASTN